MSHPVWVRGLKLLLWVLWLLRMTVAPRVGAWIETESNFFINVHVLKVAPRVGAWIETDIYQEPFATFQSHPVWVRGLKLGIFIRIRERQVSRTPCGCVD